MTVGISPVHVCVVASLLVTSISRQFVLLKFDIVTWRLCTLNHMVDGFRIPVRYLKCASHVISYDGALKLWPEAFTFAETVIWSMCAQAAPRERVERPAGKAGGVYIPPFKLAQMLREAKDESSKEYQRLRWDALRKSINGLINKVNITNLKEVLPEIFGEVGAPFYLPPCRMRHIWMLLLKDS